MTAEKTEPKSDRRLREVFENTTGQPPEWLKTAPREDDLNDHAWARPKRPLPLPAMLAPGRPDARLALDRTTGRYVLEEHPRAYDMGAGLSRIAKAAERLEKAKMGEVRRARLLKPLEWGAAVLVGKVAHGQRVVARLAKKRASRDAYNARVNAPSVSMKEAVAKLMRPLQPGQVVELDGKLRRVA